MPVRRVLFAGDVCGEPGRRAVKTIVPRLRAELGLDFVVVNAENASSGRGLSPKTVRELLSSQVDCLTSGDHFLDRKEIEPMLDTEPRLLRPLNYPPGVPGLGSGLFALGDARIGVINLQGRIFMKAIDCPFQRVLPVLEALSQETHIIVVDFHAEATAEKQAMAYYLDGRVSALFGSHTHVQTADERISAQGTAYISDVGMCGAMDSILGMESAGALRKNMLSIPVKFQPARGDIRLNGVVVEIDQASGRAQRIERINIPCPAGKGVSEAAEDKSGEKAGN